MTKSRIFFYFCLSFILGIAISSFFIVSWPALLTFLILGLSLFSFFLVNKKLAILGVCLVLLALGIWQHQQAELQIKNSELRGFSDKKESIVLIGIVSKEPDIRETNVKLTVEVEQIKLSESYFQHIVNEKALVTTSRFPEYEYGDKLKIKGKLRTPPVFDNFNYQDFLTKQGIYSVVYWPEIELLNQKNYRGPTSLIYAEILGFKNKLREVISQNLSPPQSVMLGAIIFGDQRGMSQEFREKLGLAGVRHITAVSGMHITILFPILLQIFLGLGLWRQPALYLSLVFLILFIIMIGAPASAVRAGIMGGLLIIANSLGRLSQSDRTVVFAAAGILAFNPLLLKSDIGFQLSFLAVLGIIYLMPIFQNWLKGLPDNFLGFLKMRSIVSMTFAAQIFTLPILIYNFGHFSLVAPLSNILIVPLLPLLMIVGFLFVLLGVFWLPLGWILSLPVWLLLTYIIAIVNFFSERAWSVIVFQISWLWLLVSYLILACLAWRLNKKRSVFEAGF